MTPRLLLLAALALGCSNSATPKTDDDYRRDVADGMHQALLADITDLHQAAIDLRDQAPLPTDRGWDTTLDRDAILGMQNGWIRARTAYEHTEGALAPLFSEIDFAIDARYEDFLEAAQGAGDPDPFDGEGVTGMHAIERILFIETTPPEVVARESELAGYAPATRPASAEQAARFKNGLCERLVSDTQTLLEQWTPQRIDVGGAFNGLISLVNEQREKVNNAARGEEESRYSQRTMSDIRDNLAGTQRAYALFEPWLQTKADGPQIAADVTQSFDALAQAYGQVNGDAIPTPPADWDVDDPEPGDLDTPFGRLYSAVHDAVDPARAGSAVDGMNRTARALGLPEFTPEE